MDESCIESWSIYWLHRWQGPCVLAVYEPVGTLKSFINLLKWDMVLIRTRSGWYLDRSGLFHQNHGF